MSKILYPLNVVLLLTLYMATSPVAATVDDEFEAGLTAFKSQQYPTAIEHFQQAYQLGMQTPALYYNLAVSHFKTNSYDHAKFWFAKAGLEPKLTYLCEYNMGLIALKQGDPDLARKYFRNVADNATQANLVKLAEYQLGTEVAEGQPSRWSLYAQIESGHDSNVTLATDASPTKKASAYTDRYIYGSVILAGSAQTGLKAAAYALDTRYDAVPTENIQITSIGLEQSFLLGSWQNAIGIDSVDSRLNGKHFQQTTIYEARTLYPLSPESEFRLRYRYYDIVSDPPYAELSGNKQRVRVEYRLNPGLDKFKTYYEFESNDRTETLPTSHYSPIRHTLRATYSYALGSDFSLKADLSYRVSYYNDQRGKLVRDETRTVAGVGLDYYMSQHFFISADFSQTDNQSSDPLYVYQRQISSLSLGMTF